MRTIGRIAPVILFAFAASACAARMPLADVPHGTYVLVEPAPAVYTAVTLGEGAYAIRAGDQVVRGQHWVDNRGRVHVVEDTGPCAGRASLWTYDYSNNRLTLNLVEDRCPNRSPALSQRLVYERR
jgi:hypothetical protein